MRKLWTKIKTPMRRHLSFLFAFFVSLCCIFSSSVLSVSSAHAVNFYQQPQVLQIKQHNNNWIRFSNNNNQDVAGQGVSGFSPDNGSNSYTRTFTKVGNWSRLVFYWSNNIEQGTYFYTFDVNMHSDYTTFNYYGLESQYSGKVSETCHDSFGTTWTSNGSSSVDELAFTDLTCHYVFYSWSITDHFTSSNAQIMTVNPLPVQFQSLGVDPSVTIRITGGSYYPMTWDALTDYDKEYLSGLLEGVEDATNEPDYIKQQKQDLEDAKDEAKDTAEDSGAESQQQGTSLIAILTGFVSAISHPSGNCNVDLDLTGYGAGHNNVNLCTLSPPSGITALLSVIVVGFVIMAVVHTIEAMIGIYKEYQR